MAPVLSTLVPLALLAVIATSSPLPQGSDAIISGVLPPTMNVPGVTVNITFSFPPLPQGTDAIITGVLPPTTNVPGVTANIAFSSPQLPQGSDVIVTGVPPPFTGIPLPITNILPPITLPGVTSTVIASSHPADYFEVMSGPGPALFSSTGAVPAAAATSAVPSDDDDESAFLKGLRHGDPLPFSEHSATLKRPVQVFPVFIDYDEAAAAAATVLPADRLADREGVRCFEGGHYCVRRDNPCYIGWTEDERVAEEACVADESKCDAFPQVQDYCGKEDQVTIGHHFTGSHGWKRTAAVVPSATAGVTVPASVTAKAFLPTPMATTTRSPSTTTTDPPGTCIDFLNHSCCGDLDACVVQYYRAQKTVTTVPNGLASEISQTGGDTYSPTTPPFTITYSGKLSNPLPTKLAHLSFDGTPGQEKRQLVDGAREDEEGYNTIALPTHGEDPIKWCHGLECVGSETSLETAEGTTAASPTLFTPNPTTLRHEKRPAPLPALQHE